MTALKGSALHPGECEPQRAACSGQRHQLRRAAGGGRYVGQADGSKSDAVAARSGAGEVRKLRDGVRRDHRMPLNNFQPNTIVSARGWVSII